LLQPRIAEIEKRIAERQKKIEKVEKQKNEVNDKVFAVFCRKVGIPNIRYLFLC
jgi:structural maintenance of chromosome 1